MQAKSTNKCDTNLINENISKDGYTVFTNRIEKGIVIRVTKDSIWYSGKTENLPDDEIEFTLNSIKKLEFDILP